MFFHRGKNISSNNLTHTYYSVAFVHQYRSPEEFSGNDLDEQIDVFSFGNNLYALLTGLWVYYENRDDGVAQVSSTFMLNFYFVFKEHMSDNPYTDKNYNWTKTLRR